MREFALDLWQEVAELQEQIIQERGEIERNDKRLWRPYLNKMTNEDWEALLEVLAELYETYPALFKDFHTRTIKRACEELVDADHPRVLDTRDNKGLAWNMFMVLREVWQACKIERGIVSTREALLG